MRIKNTPKQETLKGSNITFICRNKDISKNNRQHSKYLFKQMKLKYPDEEQKQSILQKLPKGKRPLTSTPVGYKNRQNINQIKRFSNENLEMKSGQTARVKKRKKKVDGSWDEKKIVENGWSNLIESKKLTTTSVDKIKKYRNTLNNRIKKQSAFSSLHIKQNSKQANQTQTLPFQKVLTSHPNQICDFSTGFTQDCRQQQFVEFTSIHKTSHMINRSQYLTKIYKRILKSKNYSQILPQKMDNNFLSLVYFLERNQNRCYLTQKQKQLMKKCKFI